MKRLGIYVLLLCGSLVHAQDLQVKNLTVTGTTALATPPVVLGDCANILSYGGVGDGNTDNATALNSLLASSAVGRACVYFPPGKYLFRSNITYTLPSGPGSISIIGAGSDVTELSWIATDGISLTLASPFNSFHVRNLTLTTSSINSGTAIKVTQDAKNANPTDSAVSDITGVTVRGADGYVTSQYWATGIDLFNVSNVNFLNDNFVGQAGAYGTKGTGIYLHGTSDNPPVAFNVSSSFFNGLGVGITYGAWVEGLSVSQSNLTGLGYGIYVPPSIQGTDQLTVIGSQFNCGLAGIIENTSVSNTMISGNLFIVPTNAIGIYLPHSYAYSIIGNTVNDAGGSTNTNGIVINQNDGGGGNISGNVLLNMTSAIFLQSASSGANVQSNSYASDTNKVVNQGAGNTIGGGSP